MAALFAVEVVTPRGPVARTESDAVTGPGVLGEFEILAGHVPFLTELHAGVLRIGQKTAETYAVSNGFLEVSSTGAVKILVERAIPAGEIDVAEAKSEAEAAGAELAAWRGEADAEHRVLVERQSFANAKLAAASRR